MPETNQPTPNQSVVIETTKQPTNKPVSEKSWIHEAPLYLKTLGFVVIGIAVLIFIFGGPERMSGLAFLVYAGFCFLLLPIFRTFSATSKHDPLGKPVVMTPEKKQRARTAVIALFFGLGLYIAIGILLAFFVSGIH